MELSRLVHWHSGLGEREVNKLHMRKAVIPQLMSIENGHRHKTVGRPKADSSRLKGTSENTEAGEMRFTSSAPIISF